MIWNLILGNRVVRFTGAALVAVLGFLTFGMVQKRKGRLAERAERTAESLKVERERVVLDAELDAETDLLKRARDSGVVRKAKR